MNPAYAAITSIVGHGGSKDLRSCGLQPEWIDDQDVRKIVECAFIMLENKTDISFPSVMTRLPEVKDWKRIASAWNDGCGSTAKEAVVRCKEDAIRRMASEIQADITKKLEGDELPSSWVPNIAMRFQNVAKIKSYDPRPSSHMGKALPEVFAPFQSHSLNEIFRGGIWSGAFIGMTGMTTGAGKSTMTYTLAGQAALSHIKSVIVSGEMPEEYATARILRTWEIPWEAIVALSKSRQSIYEERYRADYDRYLEYADQYVDIYGYEFLTLDKIRTIVQMTHPKLLQVDHLMSVRTTTKKNQTDASALAELAQGLADLAVAERCMIIAYGQLSNEDVATFQKKHDLPTYRMMGSGAIAQAARIGILMCRHWEDSNKEYFRVKKDSLTNMQDTEHVMSFNAKWWRYEDVDTGVTDDALNDTITQGE